MGLMSNLKDVTLVMGKNATYSINNENVFYIGNCVRPCSTKNFIPGCTFTPIELVEALVNFANNSIK